MIDVVLLLQLQSEKIIDEGLVRPLYEVQVALMWKEGIMPYMKTIRKKNKANGGNIICGNNVQ